MFGTLHLQDRGVHFRKIGLDMGVHFAFLAAPPYPKLCQLLLPYPDKSKEI